MLFLTLAYRYKIPFFPSEIVNRVRRISTELLSTYRGKFGLNFEENKKLLDEIAVVRSKSLKNEIAGYITAHLRREHEELKEKESEPSIPVESVDGTEEIEEQILN